jgi:putative tryptophan/tyrosine transport system substrate-binding protein
VITRRKLVQYLPMVCSLAPAASVAKESKVIGILSPFFRADIQASLEQLDDQLARLGWVKGRHYVVVERMAEGRDDALTGMADELVTRKVDLILAVANAAVEARRATSSIPIVFVSVADPVAAGLAVSLARPGLNATGLSNFVGDLTGKRLELLKQMVPGLKHIAVLVTTMMPNYPTFVPALKATASAQGIGVNVIQAPVPLRLEQVFRTLTASRPQALYDPGDAYLWAARKQVASLSLRAGLPTSFAFVEPVEEGGLMSYGADTRDWMRQSAVFIDKILNGAKPGDLPVEQPSTINLVINTRTADILRLKIPKTLLLQAARLVT